MSYELVYQAKYDLNQILEYLIRNRGDDAAFELGGKSGDTITYFLRAAFPMT